VSQIFEGHGLSQGADLSQQERPVETRETPSQDALTELPLFHVAEPSLPWESQDGFVVEGRSPDQGTGALLEMSQGVQRWEAGEVRSPFEHERDDFNEWYAMAQQFRFVTDYEWNGLEYWVLVNGQWKSFCEMVGVFSCAWLRRKLGKGDRFSED
jgi:hypothetical protein